MKATEAKKNGIKESVIFDKKEQDYWNKVHRAVESQGPGLIDNYEKRRVLVNALTKYPMRGRKVLEIGTGNGFTAYMMNLLNLPIHYKGIDISEQYAANARNRFKLDVTVTDASQLPFEDKTFDVLFAFDSFEHIHPDRREKMYSEIDRVMGTEERTIFINNPLELGYHAEDYEFGYSEKDIARLAEVTKTRLIDVQILRTDTNRMYQFIALGIGVPA